MSDTTAATQSLETAERRQHRLTVGLFCCLTFSVIGLFLAHLTLGPVTMSLGETLNGLGRWMGLNETGGMQAAAIVGDIRLPRALTAMGVGAVLALSGASLQALFRNPLADPGLVGVSAGAAFGALIAIVFGLSVLGAFALPLAAFAGALAVGAIILVLAMRPSTSGVATLLLAGIAINAVVGAGLGLLTYLSDDQQLRELTFWTLGSFSAAQWSTSGPAVLLMAAAIVMLCLLAPKLDALLLGERSAFALGQDIQGTKRHIILATTFGVGAAVCVSGMIGFVGLIVPHLVRMILGARHTALLPASALLGAALMLFADLIARLAIVPAELPVGLVTSLVGGPFFLWLVLARGRHGGFS